VEYSFLTRDHALSLWTWSTDSKTLDYQRTNPGGYQIVRTHTKETNIYIYQLRTKLIKPQLKARAVWLRKKTQNLPTSCTSCRLNPHNQRGRLCVYGIYKKDTESAHKRKHTSSDSCRHWRQEYTGVGPD